MSFEFSDESIFSITKILYTQFLSEKNMKRLEYDKVDQFKQLYIKPLYPHKETIKNGRTINQKYQCQEYCCTFSPGRFCCGNSTAPDPEYREFGLGVCLYVKFMKHLAGFLFFASILSILSITIYQFAAHQSGIGIKQSYHNTLFSTSIGVLSSQFVKCSYVDIKANTANFDIQCGVGQVKLIKPVYTNNTLDSLLNCREQNLKADQQIYIANYANLSTNSPSASQIQINISIDTDTYNGHTYKYLAFNYQCVNSQYTISTLSIPAINIIRVTIGIDIVIVVCFIFFMISQHNAQKKQIQYFKMKQLAVNDFTVKVSGFRLSRYEEDLRMFVEEYDKIRTSTMREGGVNGFINNIVQIKIPEIQQLKQASQARKEYYEKLYELMDECFFEDSIDIYRYRDYKDFIKKCYGSTAAPQFKQYKRRLTKLVYAFLQSKKVKFINDQIQMSILMVLSNPKDKKLMMYNAKNGCFSRYVKIRDRKFQVSQPPIADMVIWENKSKYTTIRVIFAWIITILICVGSYMLVAFATFKKEESLKNNNFNVGCSMLYNISQLETWQDSLYNSNTTSSSQGIYLNCYCDQNYFKFNHNDANMRNRCSTWFSQYFVYNAIPILISLGIVIYNIIIDRIFRLLTKFQGHDNLSSELYSYILKRSFILIMNMGLIIILIKLKYEKSFQIKDLSFLFQGTYSDITSDWYLDIGVIIMLTLAFNIVIPIIDMFFVSFLKCLKKCIDNQCYCVKTSKKTKKQFLELYAADVFPIQSRYSDFIALIVISLAFSAIMPLLYIISFFSIWFVFICDKLLLFRVYQKPINYSQDLQNKVFKVVYVSIMIHCVVSVFTLSQQHLMSVTASNYIYQRFLTIITTPYLIPYVVIFLLMAAWGIFDSTLINFIQYCIKKCTKQSSRIYRSKLHQNFFAALNAYQITKLKMSLQLQLTNNIEHQRQGMTSLTKIICQSSLTKIGDLQKVRNIRNNSMAEGQDNVKLIGKAGYDEAFDDEVFNREKKIKSLDYQFQGIIRDQKAIKKLKAGNIQQTVVELNL